MSSAEEDKSQDDEAKNKLRQIRSDYTRAKNILADLESYFSAFEKLRTDLDGDDGLEANLNWSKKKKIETDEIVAQATLKLNELTTLADSIRSLVAQVQAQHDTFTPLAAKITDPSTGIEALHASAVALRDKIAALLESARVSASDVETVNADITAKSTEVDAAYAAFNVLKAGIDDPETGIEAQVAEVKQYAKDALKAKTSAESELASVISLKETATENLDTIKTTKLEIDGYKDESNKLTDDIRNNLGLSSAHSLSIAITEQRKRIEHSVWLWGVGVCLSVIALGCVLALIFYALFLDPAAKSIITANGVGLLMTVLSKALFSSPFVFALYFTTTNFSRARDLRDRYRAKEIAAKNLQAYVKLLRDEFPDYPEDRLKFALHNMQSIYNDPLPGQRKRRYNIGLNKIFQFDIQEEDVEHLKDKIIESAEEIADKRSV